MSFFGCVHKGGVFEVVVTITVEVRGGFFAELVDGGTAKKSLPMRYTPT